MRVGYGGVPYDERLAILVEVVDPRWWDLPRWLRWLRAPLVVEYVLPGAGGERHYMVLRAEGVR